MSCSDTGQLWGITKDGETLYFCQCNYRLLDCKTAETEIIIRWPRCYDHPPFSDFICLQVLAGPAPRSKFAKWLVRALRCISPVMCRWLKVDRIRHYNHARIVFSFRDVTLDARQSKIPPFRHPSEPEDDTLVLVTTPIEGRWLSVTSRVRR